MKNKNQQIISVLKKTNLELKDVIKHGASTFLKGFFKRYFKIAKKNYSSLYNSITRFLPNLIIFKVL